jgi:hypothetical protein
VKRRFWTTTELRDMRALYSSTANAELAERFGRAPKAICLMAHKLGLRKSPEYISRYCRFQKRRAAWNKGRPWNPEGSRATQFKKGERGRRQRPVGTERMERDGLMVKVAEPAVWMPKARLVWEQHFGPVPAGMIVRLKDGNRANCSPENLMAVTRQENARLNAAKRKRRRRQGALWMRPLFAEVSA